MSSAVNSGLSGLRRNTKNARWLGVCAGLADWLDIPATLVRIVFIICVLTWPTLILGYFILYFCLSNELDTAKVKDFVSSSSVKNHFRNLDYRKPIFKNQRDNGSMASRLFWSFRPRFPSMARSKHIPK